ncbi:MAG: hypothetical protein AAF559_06840 [Pseudomonadota bacterium]
MKAALRMVFIGLATPLAIACQEQATDESGPEETLEQQDVALSISGEFTETEFFRCPSNEVKVVRTIPSPAKTTIQLDRDASLTITGFSQYYKGGNDPYFRQVLKVNGEVCSETQRISFPNKPRENSSISCVRNYKANTIMTIELDTSENERANPDANHLMISCAFAG